MDGFLVVHPISDLMLIAIFSPYSLMQVIKMARAYCVILVFLQVNQAQMMFDFFLRMYFIAKVITTHSI
jgi:hypothetical protein